MNAHLKNHPFWGLSSPLIAFSGAALLIIASSRIQAALLCALALLWVNMLTMLAAGALREIFPEKYAPAVLPFVSSFAALLFFFALFLAAPLAALESEFFVALCPVHLVVSGLYGRVKEYDTGEMVLQGAAEAALLGLLVLGMALVREPLGLGSMSLPGLGEVRFADGPFALFRFSSGALILLGYGVAVYRRFRRENTGEED
jgi:hypothetical protein